MSLRNTLNALPVGSEDLLTAISRGGITPPNALAWGHQYSRNPLSICTRLMIEHGECAYYLCTTTIGGKPRIIACPTRNGNGEGIGSGTAFCIQILIQGVLTKVCLPIWRSIW